MAVPCRGAPAVSFLPQILRFPVDFWAGGPPGSNRHHPAATALPQMCTGGYYPHHEELSRNARSPVWWGAWPVPEVPILSVYVPFGSSLQKITQVGSAALARNAVWIG